MSLSATTEYQRGVLELLHWFEIICAPPPPDENKSGFYGWGALPLAEFYEGMQIAAEALDYPQPPMAPPDVRLKFLDVGSGIGSKLFLADRLGWEASGIEIHEPYAETSRIIFPQFSVETIGAHDFDRYHEFDLIYSFRIVVDTIKQHCLNEIIAERMRPGALFFMAGGPDPKWLEHVGGHVWRV